MTTPKDVFDHVLVGLWERVLLIVEGMLSGSAATAASTNAVAAAASSSRPSAPLTELQSSLIFYALKDLHSFFLADGEGLDRAKVEVCFFSASLSPPQDFSSHFSSPIFHRLPSTKCCSSTSVC